MLTSSGSHSVSPLLQCANLVESSLQLDLLSLHVILVKDSASSNASICWRYFGLLATTASSPLSSLTEAANAGADVESVLTQSPVPSIASSDADFSVPNVINRGFYYCKLCLEREQDEYRTSGGRHGALSNVHKYSVHTATTAYKAHLFNAHGVVDKTSNVCGASVMKLDASSIDELNDYAAVGHLSTTKKLDFVMATCSKTEPPAWTTEEFHRDVCLWFVRDLRSFDAVADVGFEQFCSKNFPNFSLPLPTALGRNWLEQMYADVKDRVKASLFGVRALCVMVDAWTDRYRRTPFIGLRVAYVEPVSWMFRMASLSVKVAPYNTGAERAAHIRSELRDYGVADDCIIYTTDDASEAARHCGQLLKSAHETSCVALALDRLIVADALYRVPVTCRLMNKCVTVIESLYCRLGLVADEMTSLQEKQRKELVSLNELVVKIKSCIDLDERIATTDCDDDAISCDLDAETDTAEGSSSRSLDARVLSSAGDKQPHKAATSGPAACSRWNVILTMLDGLLETLPAVQSTLKKCGNRELCFDEQELTIMKTLAKFLAPFREFSEMIAGSHPHLGLLLMVRDQIDDFCRPCRRDAEPVAAFKRKIRQNLERRILVDDTVIAASVLEPGTRAIVALDQEEQVRIVAKIWSETENELASDGCGVFSKCASERQSPVELNSSLACDRETCSADDNTSALTQSTEAGGQETGVESKRKRIIRQILLRRGLSIGGEETIQSEITRYLNTKATEEEERAPLMFWKNNRKNFPRLHRLAKNLLSISAGRLAVEELFSPLGLLRNGKKMQLSPMEINLMSVVHDSYSTF